MRALRAPRQHVRTLARVSILALLAGLLQVLAAAPASAKSPQGVVDVAQGSEPGRVHVRGWAFDSGDPTVAVDIHLYVGTPGADYGVDLGPANTYRPDVNSVYGVGDYHGFDAVVDIPRVGAQEWRIYAIDPHGGPNPMIGNGALTISNPDPVGSFQFLDSPGDQQVRVSGWAGDPNNPPATLGIYVYIGGPIGSEGADLHVIYTSVQNSDGAAAGYSPLPGFSSTMTTTKTGKQPVYVYAVNHPMSPGVDTFLGSSTVDIRGDTTPPDTQITSAPETATPTDVIRIQFTATEINSTFECRWDEAAWTACVSNSAISLPPDNHMISVRATDTSSNVDPVPATRVVAVSQYAAQPAAPPPPSSAAASRAIAAGAVKKKTQLRVNVDPDSADTNYVVVIQRKFAKKWRTISRVHTRGSHDVVAVDLRRGKYRAVLPKSAQGSALISDTVRLRR